MGNTRDTRNFNIAQLQLAGKLLACIGTERDQTAILGKNVAVELNRESKIIFLIDSQFQVAVLDGNLLRDWFRCACGCEGFEHTMSGKDCCKAHVDKELQNRCRKASARQGRHAG